MVKGCRHRRKGSWKREMMLKEGGREGGREEGREGGRVRAKEGGVLDTCGREAGRGRRGCLKGGREGERTLPK